MGKIRGHRLCIKLAAIEWVSPGKMVKTWDRCFGSITSLWYQSAKKKRKSSIEVSKVFFLCLNSGVFAKKKNCEEIEEKKRNVLQCSLDANLIAIVMHRTNVQMGWPYRWAIAISVSFRIQLIDETTLSTQMYVEWKKKISGRLNFFFLHIRTERPLSNKFPLYTFNWP